MPCKTSAFYPRREIAHARESCQPAQLFRVSVRCARQHLVYLVKQSLPLALGFPLDRGRHHRCRGFRNGTARSLKPDVLDQIPLEHQINRNLISTQGIESFRFAIGALRLLKIARTLVMVQDNLLVEIAEIRHYANTDSTPGSERARQSISPFVL